MQQGVRSQFTDRELGVVPDVLSASGAAEELADPGSDGADRGEVADAAPHRVVSGRTGVLHGVAHGRTGGISGSEGAHLL